MDINTPDTTQSEDDRGTDGSALERDPGSLLGAVIGWFVTAAIVILLMVAQMTGGLSQASEELAEPIAGVTEAPPEERLAESNAMFTATARMLVGLPEKERSNPSNLGVLPMLASTPDDQLRLAILRTELLGYEESRSEFEAIAIDHEDDDALQADLAIATALYAGEPVDEASAERMLERHGWFWELASVWQADADDPARSALLASASRVTVAIISAEVALLVVFILSFGLFIFAVVRLATGKLTCAFTKPAPGGSVFVETFALFLVAFIGVTIVSEYASEVIGPFSGLLRWSVLLVALWPMARGMSFADLRQRLGWHSGKGVFREIALGVVGYIACLPIVALGIGITLGLMALNKLFKSIGADEEVAGEIPVHPIGEMIGNGSLVEIMLLVTLATLWAPIVEETFFRGALYRHCRGRVIAPLSGLFTGLVFAAIHPQGWMGIPALMFIGFVLAMLREWRGTLIAPMVAHAMNNGTVMVILLMMFFL